ncbi:hypothetical protein M2318_005115 [Metapseudomonas resinovorans]|uniref:hypothetical protein n=1 Tax=Metapseudomonas resinovorans TaxID=53412 RepID=UPI003D24D264
MREKRDLLRDIARKLNLNPDHEHIAHQIHDTITLLQDAAHQLKQRREIEDEPLICDFCQCELKNPWHGSGVVGGKERRHLHACDGCRDQLPDRAAISAPQHPLQSCLRDNGELIGLQATVAQHERIVAAKDAILDQMRRDGFTIDGDNAYKRDLLDCVVGALAFGKQGNPAPPEWHWLHRFWEIGDAERKERDELRAYHSARSLNMVEVPIAPTRAMWEAAGNAVVELQHAGVGHHDKIAEAVWHAMINAASVVKAASDSGEGQA